MAEAYLRFFGNDQFEAYSAGVTPSTIHPLTKIVMQEDQIDISQQYSKALDEIPVRKLDLLVTLCGHAQANCPSLPITLKKEHWPIDDPIGFLGSEEERLKKFRQTRDTIRSRISDFIKITQTAKD